MIKGTQERLNNIFEITFGITNVESDHRLISDFNLDSLDIMELVVQVENTFDIEISDLEQSTIFTVDDLYGIICEKIMY